MVNKPKVMLHASLVQNNNTTNLGFDWWLESSLVHIVSIVPGSLE